MRNRISGSARGQTSRKWWKSGRVRIAWLAMLTMIFGGVFLYGTSYGSAPSVETVAARAEHASFKPFEMFWSDAYDNVEIVAVMAVLVVAVAGLLYALLLVNQVKRADQGTARMQEIAAAVREGANAYLRAQFRKIGRASCRERV